MKKGELKWMINELNDKKTVIRGYAQLALECDHPNWAKKYIASIIQQIDKLTTLTTIISDLYLDGEDNSYGCKSEDKDKLLYGKLDARLH